MCGCKVKGIKTPKPRKVSSIYGLAIGLEQLIEKQRSDKTLKRYWQLADVISGRLTQVCDEEGNFMSKADDQEWS